MQPLTIGKVAELSNAGVETIRFRERQGLIEEPLRRPSGYRHYPTATADRVRFIRRGKDLGFTLGEIGELMSLRGGGGKCRSEVRAVAEANLRDLDQNLTRSCTPRLMGLLSRVPYDIVPDCRALEALSEPDDEPSTGRRATS